MAKDPNKNQPDRRGAENEDFGDKNRRNRRTERSERFRRQRRNRQGEMSKIMRDEIKKEVFADEAKSPENVENKPGVDKQSYVDFLKEQERKLKSKSEKKETLEGENNVLKDEKETSKVDDFQVDNADGKGEKGEEVLKTGDVAEMEEEGGNLGAEKEISKGSDEVLKNEKKTPKPAEDWLNFVKQAPGDFQIDNANEEKKSDEMLKSDDLAGVGEKPGEFDLGDDEQGKPEDVFGFEEEQKVEPLPGGISASEELRGDDVGETEEKPAEGVVEDEHKEPANDFDDSLFGAGLDDGKVESTQPSVVEGEEVTNPGIFAEADEEARDEARGEEQESTHDDLFGEFDDDLSGNDYFPPTLNTDSTDVVEQTPNMAVVNEHLPTHSDVDLFGNEKHTDFINKDTSISESGIKHESDLFGGDLSAVEIGSENIFGVEGSAGASEEDNLFPENNHEDIDEKVVDKTLNSGREKVNQILEQPVEPEGGGFSGFVLEVRNILGQVGFSFRTLRNCFVIVLFLGMIFLGWWFKWYVGIGDYFKNLDFLNWFTSKTEVQTQEGQVVSYDWSIRSGEIFGRQLYGNPPLPDQIRSGLYFGESISLEGNPLFSGIKVGLLYGESTDTTAVSRFSYYVQVAGQMRNLYYTDLLAALDNSDDRTKTLNEYFALVKVTYQRGVDLAAEIASSMADVQAEFDAVTVDKDEKEKEFFSYLDVYDGDKSDLALRQFIELRQNQEDLRSKYNALKKLAGDYKVILAGVEKKIKSIELNREALIKGVKITPIPGDNLGLILEEVK